MDNVSFQAHWSSLYAYSISAKVCRAIRGVQGYHTYLRYVTFPRSRDNGLIGYSEPLRRFIQHEGFSPQVNEIPNEMPSWIPGDDYLTNFHKGDPYIKVEEGYARLPGAGYAALHPELEGVDPEDYPDIDKLRILGDVAPYSREYQKLHGSLAKHLKGDPELRAEYERISEQVRQTKE